MWALHSKVPLVCLLGLVHLGVSLTCAVLGGTWRGNQGGVHHRAGLEHQAFGGQGGIDGGQQLDAQVVLLKQVTESQDGALVRQSHSAGVQPCKFAVQRNIVQGFFHCRIRQTEPLLQKVDAQHGLHGKRRTPAFRPCAAQGTTRFISSRNARLRVLLVTSSNPVVARLICS